VFLDMESALESVRIRLASEQKNTEATSPEAQESVLKPSSFS